ncbi:MAG: tRNA lysidine(34) synthetase TilS [Vicinamibacterales bacterium]|jgi:tRNA(Ile)-lysidine synthase
MARLIDRVRRYAAQHALWRADPRVIVAMSGGSDSVALFFLLRELAASGDCALAGVAHLHHHIRGQAADEDAAFCRNLALRTGVPAVIGDADVPALAARDGVSMEVAGRHARQGFYLEAQATLNAARVAVAHTRDDQAETVLLRLVRGAGSAGLSGMAPRRDHLVRPLLEITRAELRAYLDEIGEPWREDATNADRAIPRNLIRHEVLPRLRQLNAQADAALARAADILRTDAAFLDSLASEAAARLVRLEEGPPSRPEAASAFAEAAADKSARSRRSSLDGSQAEADASGASGASGAPRRIAIDAEELGRLPLALARRVALRALETANPSRSYGLEEAQLLCEAAAGGAGASLAGLDMERFGASVVLVSRARRRGQRPLRRGLAEAREQSGERRRMPSADQFELQLGIPGAVTAPHGRWTLTAAGPMPRPEAMAAEAGQVMVDAGTLSPGLIVRPRRPGDRLHPLGAPGRKKVQDVFVDRKIPRDERDREPIVTDEMGRIVWVAGQVLAEPFRVTPLTMTVVVLTLRRQ